MKCKKEFIFSTCPNSNSGQNTFLENFTFTHIRAKVTQKTTFFQLFLNVRNSNSGQNAFLTSLQKKRFAQNYYYELLKKTEKMYIFESFLPGYV